MSTIEQPDTARIEANAAAIAVNPVYENERLAELTHWGAPWANLRVVVVGMGTSGDAVTDVLAQLGAKIVVIDGADTPEKRERIEVYRNAYGPVSGLFGPEHMRALPLVDGQEPELVVTSPDVRPDHPVMLDAYERRIQIWGDVELAWRLNERNDRPTPKWLCLTGTNGKTTSTYMLESVFRTGLGVKTGLIGTIQILIDGVSVPSKMTTPESPHVHSLLTIMGQHQVRCAAMEVSSHAIDYHRVDGVKYAVAGFTNLTQDHLDLHGTMEHYFDSKAQLFTPERAELAVITADDEWGEKMFSTACEQMGAQQVHRLVTARGTGLAEVPAEFGARDWAVVKVQREGLGHRFHVANGAGESVECYTGLPADFNVSNAALAALMAYLDTDFAAARAGVRFGSDSGGAGSYAADFFGSARDCGLRPQP